MKKIIVLIAVSVLCFANFSHAEDISGVGNKYDLGSVKLKLKDKKETGYYKLEAGSPKKTLQDISMMTWGGLKTSSVVILQVISLMPITSVAGQRI